MIDFYVAVRFLPSRERERETTSSTLDSGVACVLFQPTSLMESTISDSSSRESDGFLWPLWALHAYGAYSVLFTEALRSLLLVSAIRRKDTI